MAACPYPGWGEFVLTSTKLVNALPSQINAAMSNEWCTAIPAWPTLLVTVQLGVHTYASIHWSSPRVTTIDVSGSIGDRALRTTRTGEPAFVCSTSGPQAVPSHDRVFGLFIPPVPVLDRYATPAASGATVFD